MDAHLSPRAGRGRTRQRPGEGARAASEDRAATIRGLRSRPAGSTMCAAAPAVRSKKAAMGEIMKRLRAALAAFAIAAALIPPAAGAAEWPTKPVKHRRPLCGGRGRRPARAGVRRAPERGARAAVRRRESHRRRRPHRHRGGGAQRTRRLHADGIGHAVPRGRAGHERQECELRSGARFHPHRLSRRAAEHVRGAFLLAGEILQGADRPHAQRAERRRICVAEHRLGRQHGRPNMSPPKRR